MEQQSDSWGIQECDTHNYRGVPPCPWRDEKWEPCVNGTQDDFMHFIRAARIGMDREPWPPPTERFFTREWRRNGKVYTFYWRELVPKEPDGTES